jgi:hypothetical protein
VELFEDHVEDDTAELCDHVDESLHEVLVVQDELLLLEVVPVECGVVVVTEPVPHDACPGGPYPPGMADAPPTAATKAKMRSMSDVMYRIPGIIAMVLSLIVERKKRETQVRVDYHNKRWWDGRLNGCSPVTRVGRR